MCVMLKTVARAFFRLHERLLGRRTFAIFGELESSQYWPRQRIEALQLERLRSLVSTAHEHSLYWRHVMDHRGIAPGDIRSLADIRRFPLLTKQTIRDRREQMVWRGEPSGVKLTRTSGSTNAALDFYTSADREAHISAARMRGHSSIGIRPEDKELYFWAAPVELSTQGRIKAVRDWLRNDGFTNALDITSELAPRYIESWRRWGAECLFGYVSSFNLLAGIAVQDDIDLTCLKERGLRAIVTTAELLGERRNTISDAFGVPVYDSYGIREGGLIGHECDHFTMHTNDEQLVLETIDRHTLEPTDGEGELVVTMLSSHCMPVIRYRTGDIVTLSKEPCSCGRSLRSLHMSGGRMMEFVVTSEGRWVSAVAFIYAVREVKGTLQIQARQDRLGEVRVLVAAGREFPSDGVERIRRSVAQRLKSQDKIVVELVDEIPPAPSGKQRLVISKVAEQMLRRSPCR